MDAAADDFSDCWADECEDAWADAACDAIADAWADASCDVACDAIADAWADASCDAIADAWADASCDAMADAAFNSLYQSQSPSRYRSRFPAREPAKEGTRGAKNKFSAQDTWQQYYTGGEKRGGLSTVNNSTRNLNRYCSPSSSSNTRLFVGGLSWSLDEKTLKDAFSTFGNISEVKIIYDRYSGRSRGFGFVHFSKEEDATCAKDAMDGKSLSGQPLRVSFALQRVRREPEVIPHLRNTRDFSKRVRREPVVLPRHRNTRDF